MTRREFMILLGAAPVAWPLAGRAQQAERMRRVGVLMPFPENDASTQADVTAFAQALGRFGWIEDKNIRTDYRFAAGDPTLFKMYAAELVSLSPAAILAGNTPAAAAKPGRSPRRKMRGAWTRPIAAANSRAGTCGYDH